MSATIIPFPPRPCLSREERSTIARWTAAAGARGIAKVWVSARRPRDGAEVQDRILIVGDGRPATAWIVHRPARRWLVRRGNGAEVVGEFASIGDALEAVHPSSPVALGHGAGPRGVNSATERL